MERALPPPAQANDPDPTDPPQAQAGAANTVQAPEQAAQQTTQRPPVTTVQLPRKESAAAQVAPDRQPHQSEPISFWQLPVDIRSQMPPLKITVLVWAERAADRFVLLDSRRRVEGDEVAPGLLVEEIRRDGVVLSFRAYRFLVHH
jgi:general secretion pathway protein B